MIHTIADAHTELTLASWARTACPSPLQEMLTAASRPGIISLALGMPDEKLFPTAEFAQAAQRVVATDPYALQYGPHSQPLKAQVVELMKRRGVVCKEGQVFLTAGAQQGMCLLARLLLEPGSEVIAEELIYTGFQQVLEPFQPRVLTVPTSIETGMDVDAVEAHLRRGARPAFIYAITEGHNPLSVSLSKDKRVRLVELARQYGLPIIEDDAYGFLCYEGKLESPLRALDEQYVLYVGSFSKIVAPGLRVGWLVVPEGLIKPLSIVKESTDIDSTTFPQRVLNAYLETGQLADHIKHLCDQYRLRRDTMLDSLREHFPEETRWTTPSSGMFLWLENDNVDAAELFNTALSTAKVAFIPGFVFSVGPVRLKPHSMRLNFSYCSPENIREGIARLGRLLSH
jgi:2-aminoadipate transaminase